MFPDGAVKVVRTPEGAVLKTSPPFVVTAKAGNRTIPTSLEIWGFESYEEALEPMDRWLNEVPASIDVSQLYVRLQADQYALRREMLNNYTTPWEFWFVGRLTPETMMWLEDPRKVPDVPDWVPLIQWWRRRTVEGMQIEYHFLCSAVREDGDLRIEVTSNWENLNRVLKDAQEGTGMNLELLDAHVPSATATRPIS